MAGKDKVFLILSLLFVFSLFTSHFFAGSVPALAMLALYSLFYNSLAEKKALLKGRAYLWVTLGFAVWLVISAATSSNLHSAGRTLTLRLPLIVLPLTFGLVKLNTTLRNKILTGSALVIAGCCFVSFLYAVFRYSSTGNTAWLYNDYLSLFTGQQSIYTSALVDIAIFILAWRLFYFRSRANGLLTLTLLFLFLFSFLLASRNLIALLYASTVIFLLSYFVSRKKYLEGVTVLLGIILLSFTILRVSPSTLNRFRELMYTEYNYGSMAKESHYAGTLTSEQWNGADFRLAAWPCGWEVFRKHPVTGVGLGDKREELMKVFAEKKFHFAIATNRNVHNNYLDLLLGTGLIGFILCITGWIIIPVLRLARQRSWLSCLILLTLAGAMVTENYFDRTFGPLILGSFTLLLLSDYPSLRTGCRHNHSTPDHNSAQ